MGEHEPLCDDSAHRVAEQVEAIEAERVDGGERIGDELVERVGGGVAGVRGVAVAAVVPGDHSAIGGEIVDHVLEIDATAGEAVHQDEGRRRSVAAVVDGQRDGIGSGSDLDGAVGFVHAADRTALHPPGCEASRSSAPRAPST